MGFLRSELVNEGQHYKVTLFFTYYYFWEYTVEKCFDTEPEALEWILYERCYNNLDVQTEQKIYKAIPIAKSQSLPLISRKDIRQKKQQLKNVKESI